MPFGESSSDSQTQLPEPGVAKVALIAVTSSRSEAKCSAGDGARLMLERAHLGGAATRVSGARFKLLELAAGQR